MDKLVSNDEILEKAKKLVNSIKEDKKYKEYLDLRKKIESNDEIKKRMEKVKSLQKKYVKSAYLDTNIERELKKELNILESIPLYNSYINKEKEINNIFISIREGLNILFDDILNRSDK